MSKRVFSSTSPDSHDLSDNHLKQVRVPAQVLPASAWPQGELKYVEKVIAYNILYNDNFFQYFRPMGRLRH